MNTPRIPGIDPRARAARMSRRRRDRIVTTDVDPPPRQLDLFDLDELAKENARRQPGAVVKPSDEGNLS